MKAPSPYPKTLVLSFSGIGSSNATGQLLKLLFEDWSQDRLLQLYLGHHPEPGISGIDLASVAPSAALEICRRFQPDVIYFRPTDNHPEYVDCACAAIAQSDAPLVTHIMDDWPERLGNSPADDQLRASLQWIFDRSATRLTICQEMSDAYSKRYGHEFGALANGIDIALWESLAATKKNGTDPFTIRYAGALANDMQKQSITEITEAVSTLALSGKNVRLEIYTMPWFRAIADELAKAPNVHARDLVPKQAYPDLLASADAVVLAYNFDPKSIRYTRLSFANKTPECIASGSPVLAYGPAIVPAINYVQANDLATVVDEQSPKQLARAIASMIDEPGPSQQTAQRAKRFALKHHNAETVRRRFVQIMQDAAQQQESSKAVAIKTFSREEDVTLDETQVVFEYFRAEPPGLMVDVGAHHGSAFKPFLDTGWVVHGFEPDPNNREYITDRLATASNLTMNAEAVSNLSGEKLPFFASDQSTGISSLIPFHEGHKRVATIETTTLKDYCQSNGLQSIDFLKIDTEGYDLRVLEGLDWNSCRPSVIECEFEDAKTTKIGYDFDDLAQFLLTRDYTIYVSEWHPIIRYGIRHQWHGLQKYPCKLYNPSSWGNLLAFKEPIPQQQVERLFLKDLAKRNPDKPLVAEQTPPATAENAPTEPLAHPQQHGSHAMNPLTNHLRILRRFASSRPGQLTIAAGLIVFGVNAIHPMLGDVVHPEFARWAALAISFAAALYVVAYLRERTLFDAANASRTDNLAPLLQRTQQELATLRNELKALRNELARREEKDLRPDIVALRDQLGALELSNNKRFEASTSALRGEIDAHSEDLIEMQQRYVDLKGKLPTIVQMINNLRSESTSVQ